MPQSSQPPTLDYDRTPRIPHSLTWAFFVPAALGAFAAMTPMALKIYSRHQMLAQQPQQLQWLQIMMAAALFFGLLMILAGLWSMSWGLVQCVQLRLRQGRTLHRRSHTVAAISSSVGVALIVGLGSRAIVAGNLEFLGLLAIATSVLAAGVLLAAR